MKKVCTQVMTMDLFVDSMMVLRTTMVISLPMQVIVSQEIVEWIDQVSVDLHPLQELSSELLCTDTQECNHV